MKERGKFSDLCKRGGDHHVRSLPAGVCLHSFFFYTCLFLNLPMTAHRNQLINLQTYTCLLLTKSRYIVKLKHLYFYIRKYQRPTIPPTPSWRQPTTTRLSQTSPNPMSSATFFVSSSNCNVRSRPSSRLAGFFIVFFFFSYIRLR